jgi:protein-disulfide isomerase
MSTTASPHLRKKTAEAEEKYLLTVKPVYLAAILVILAFALGLGSGYLLWGKGGGPAAVARAVSATSTALATQATADPAQAEQVTRYDIPTDNDPSEGPQNAAITIVEFSDYQCPYCRQWHSEVYQKLLSTYEGKVRFVYRDFPLTSIHPEAEPAAEAANCANEQGKFWQYHDLLFGGPSQLGQAAYKQYAAQVGLDGKKFDECLNSSRYQAEIQSDLDFATNLGIRSTPTFFINGIALVGAQPYDVFKQVIDKELAGGFPK